MALVVYQGEDAAECPMDIPCSLETSQAPTSCNARVPAVAQKLSLQCPVLDALLGGGLPCRLVTEVFGESAAGKTQLCMQLLLGCQLPVSSGGLEGSSLCIYTEGRFPIKRLMQLAESPRFAASTQSSQAEGCVAGSPCDKVFIKELHDGSEVLEYLETDVMDILREPPGGIPIRLLVLDSAAGVFRSDYDNTSKDMADRSQAMLQMSRCLRKLAEQFDLAVLVTNQVVERIDEDSMSPQNLAASQMGMELVSSTGTSVLPALGMVWAHCVGMRLFVTRSPRVLQLPSGSKRVYCDGSDDRQLDHGDMRVVRTLQVVQSPYLPQSSCPFIIAESGLHGCVGNGRQLCLAEAMHQEC